MCLCLYVCVVGWRHSGCLLLVCSAAAAVVEMEMNEMMSRPRNETYMARLLARNSCRLWDTSRFVAS